MTSLKQPFGYKFDIRRYELTFRVFYFAFAMAMFPYVLEAFISYGDVPDRFLGNFYFGPFWMGWGTICIIACLIAILTDSIRAQGMCISLFGTWCLFRIIQNVVDGSDGERFVRATSWGAWFVVAVILSFHMSRTRPSVKYMDQVVREREMEQKLVNYERAYNETRAEEGG